MNWKKLGNALIAAFLVLCLMSIAITAIIVIMILLSHLSTVGQWIAATIIILIMLVAALYVTL